ncbi:uncharacterized protein IWZ02DRAFT_433668 [Phyllosticta citriasiana]|uniref:uncharacterized protein n=1 Tax=Phyllosticta citriasiana TaxID=595635 RepID=UPI0030FDB200
MELSRKQRPVEYSGTKVNVLVQGQGSITQKPHHSSHANTRRSQPSLPPLTSNSDSLLMLRNFHEQRCVKLMPKFDVKSQPPAHCLCRSEKPHLSTLPPKFLGLQARENNLKMPINVQFESPDPRLPNNQLKSECESAVKGREIHVAHRSSIRQGMVERVLRHYKSVPKNSKVWEDFLSLKPEIVRDPDFLRDNLPLDTSHYSGYILGLVAQCSSVAVEAADPCTCCRNGSTFSSCRQVIWPGRGYLWGGCCVGCRFNRSAKKCSFHPDYCKTQPKTRVTRRPRERPQTTPMVEETPPVMLEGIEDMANGSNDTPAPRNDFVGAIADMNGKFDQLRRTQITQLALVEKQYKTLERQNKELARKVESLSEELQRQVSRIEASREFVRESEDEDDKVQGGRRLRSRFFVGEKRLPR